MLQQILMLKGEALTSYDASDALAVAVCHHFQDGPVRKVQRGKKGGWKEFIAMNPQKVKT